MCNILNTITITTTIDPKLHAHNSGGWRSKVAAVKLARDFARLMCYQQPRLKGPVVLDIELTVPDRRRRDILNLCQSLKPTIDGVVDAGCIEGDHWECLSVGSIRVAIGEKLQARLIFAPDEKTRPK